MKKGNMFWSNCRRKKLLLCQIVSVNISRKVAKGTFSSSLRIEFWWNHLPHPGSAQLKVWAGADLFTFSLPPEPLPLSSKLVHGGVELLPKRFVEETIGSGRWIIRTIECPGVEGNPTFALSDTIWRWEMNGNDENSDGKIRDFFRVKGVLNLLKFTTGDVPFQSNLGAWNLCKRNLMVHGHFKFSNTSYLFAISRISRVFDAWRNKSQQSVDKNAKHRKPIYETKIHQGLQIKTQIYG